MTTEGPNGRRPRVLVVDDSQAMRLTLAWLLTDLGMEVVEADNGLEALRHLGEAPFDIAFFDWYMPGLDGLALVQAVRSRPELAGLRVIMVTSETEDQLIASAMAVGVDEYVTKPFDRSVFEAKLALIGFGPEPVS